MTRKYTLEEAREAFLMAGYVLLATAYHNNTEKLSCDCAEGHECNLSLQQANRSGVDACQICKTKKGLASRLKFFDDIKKTFAKIGYTLLTTSTNYCNNRKKLDCLCPLGHRCETRYSQVQQGHHPCKICNTEAKKKSFDDVKKVFDGLGYTLLATKSDYARNDVRLDCLCDKNHKCKTTYSQALRGVGSCKICQREKTKNTNIERHNAPNPMQNRKIFEKWLNSGFTLKEYTFPSGETMMVQGYEGFCIDELLREEYSEDEIIKGKDLMPAIWYAWNGKRHKYYPDLYLHEDNLIIEVKSEYTNKIDPDRIQAKAKACAAKGYSTEVRIYNRKGRRVKTLRFIPVRKSKNCS